MNNIKCVRLVTGEDIICEYTEENNEVVMHNPVQVSVVPSKGREPNFGFIPFPLVSNDKDIRVRADKVMYICEPAEEFVMQYKTIFGGIVTPAKTIII